MMMERLSTTPSGSRPRSNSGPADVEGSASTESQSRGSDGTKTLLRAVDDTYEASALERRHQQLNQLFGIKVWKSSIRHRPIETRSAEVRQLYTEPKKAPQTQRGSFTSIDNIIYLVLFGWWIWLLYLLVGAFFSLLCMKPLASMAFHLGAYYCFPFGKFIVRHHSSLASKARVTVDENNISAADDESMPLRPQNYSQQQSSSSHPHAHAGPWGTVAGVLWIIISSILLVPAHALIMAISWFSIFMIPMAKVNRTGMVLLFDSPYQLEVEYDYPGVGDEIELCVHQAANIYYYKYSVGGMNVIPVNLMLFVVFTVLIGYVPPFRELRVHPYAKFAFSLLSIVPLAYYIGMALSSISAQTSLAVGAVLNATFGSIIELILFFNALSKGFTELTVAAVTGGLLGNMLLLPGVSMICGGIKFRNQSFNKISAGVSSVLLIISIVGVFTPTICYRTFGHYTFDCTNCTISGKGSNSSYACNYCMQGSLADADLHNDPIYQKNIRPLTWIIAALLPCAYVVGLLFTLKTHADIYNPPAKEGGGGHEGGEHDAPEWSRMICIIILVVSTILLALVSEELVSAIQPTLEASGITEAFMGVSLLAVVPSTAEYVNAIQFALQNNVALSIEIGSSGAVQIAMIQVPLLVLFSTIWGVSGHQQGVFPLVFPFLDVLSVLFCVLIVNYVSIEGRSNYFLGCGLSFTWILLIGAFYFVRE